MTKDRTILIKNIYHMLTYAFRTLKQENYESVAKENFDNIHDLLAAILAKGIGQQLKQGLYREYISQKEDLALVRGKIDMPGTIRNKMARKQRLSCEYDELSENNLLNQILKTTVFILIRQNEVSAERKSDLKKEMLFFANVDTLEPKTIKWSTIRFQRNSQTYQMLIALCQFILDGMLLTTEHGEYKLASFMDEQKMYRLYERFVLEYYRKEYKHTRLKVDAPQIEWVLAVDDDDAQLPKMQSDIVLSYGDKTLIIDAKYYSRATQVQFGKHSIWSHNLYQIFTYVKNKEASCGDGDHEVAGMLLYAKTEEEIQPEGEYHMSGNKISVKTLNLNREFDEIKRTLDGIVEEYFRMVKESDD